MVLVFGSTSTVTRLSPPERRDNLKQADVKALAVITPALLGLDFFKEAAAIVNADGPPDVEKLKAVMAKHGLVPALPPGASR